MDVQYDGRTEPCQARNDSGSLTPSLTGLVTEVGGAQHPGGVDLLEEDLLGRSLGGSPRLDLPLQGAELAVGEPAREAALEVLEEGLGLEPGLELQAVAEFRPDVLERVLPGPPGPGGE